MSFELPDEVALMDDEAALPRDNGELVFAEPWHARVVATAVALVEHLGVPWDTFRDRLKEAVADHPDRAYYESWAVALEAMVVDLGVAAPDELELATPTERPSL